MTDKAIVVPRRQSNGISLGRIFGIEIDLDWSWLVIFALVTLSLSGHFAGLPPDLPQHLAWLAAGVASLLFFASILAHELSHSLLARWKGIDVHGITLFIFGGVARLKGEPKRPAHEFMIAAIGPVSSAVIGLGFLAIAHLAGAGSVVGGVYAWLGSVNLGLALFNLLPGFPLDGGRVFRAVVWAITGSLRKATRVAAASGRIVAFGLIFLGVALAFGFGAVVNGLWLGLIGWFLLSAARSGVAQQELGDVLGKLPVRRILRTDCVPVGSGESVEDLVYGRILPSGRKCFLVSDQGAPLGLVTPDEVRGVSRDAWPVTSVEEIMVPFDGVPGVTPRDSLASALKTMDEHAVNQLPVMEGDELVGVVTREDVLRVGALNLELGTA